MMDIESVVIIWQFIQILTHCIVHLKLKLCHLYLNYKNVHLTFVYCFILFKYIFISCFIK